jgi:hypothetical protein
MDSKRKLATVEDYFNPKYDPTELLDPVIANEINNLEPEARTHAVDKAFDEAGTLAKLRRYIGGITIGKDIYKKQP